MLSAEAVEPPGVGPVAALHQEQLQQQSVAATPLLTLQGSVARNVHLEVDGMLAAAAVEPPGVGPSAALHQEQHQQLPGAMQPGADAGVFLSGTLEDCAPGVGSAALQQEQHQRLPCAIAKLKLHQQPSPGSWTPPPEVQHDGFGWKEWASLELESWKNGAAEREVLRAKRAARFAA